MIKVFLFIFVMSHGQLGYKAVEAPSKEACEAVKPELLKKIIEEDHPDSLDIKCVEVNLASVT